MPSSTANPTSLVAKRFSGVSESGLSASNLYHSTVLICAFAIIVALPTVLALGMKGFLAAPLAMAMVWPLATRVPPEAVMRLYQALPLPSDQNEFSRVLESLGQRAGLRAPPRLYIVPSTTLNAFTVGSRQNPVIAVTEGLLSRLSPREASAVLAHEIAHIRNNDLMVMGLADTISRALQLLSYTGVSLALFNLFEMAFGDPTVSWWAVLALYFAPTLFGSLKLALARSREFEADATAAGLLGETHALVSAIRRIEIYTGRFWNDAAQTATIGRRASASSLLRSHPSTDERVDRLLADDASASDAEPFTEFAPELQFAVAGRALRADARSRYRWSGF